VTDEKRDGDDLFEDLDKFFAPIKDVDWDEPASEGAKATPSEEHVTVHAGVEEESSVMANPPVPDDDDDSWYDTSVIDTIETIETIDDPVSTFAQPEGAEIPEPEGVEAFAEPEGAERMAGQEDLFATDEDDVGGPETLDTDTAEWPVFPETETEVEIEDEEAPIVLSTYEVDPVDVPSGAPSEAELEAAAEHFSAPTAAAGVGVGAELMTDEGAEVERDILADLSEPDDQPPPVMVASEGLGGPSWQEPASVEVGADLESRRGPDDERDVPAAFLTGLVLAGVALGSLLIGKGVFAIIATLVVLVAQGEMHGVLVKHHHQPATAVGLVTGVLMMAGAYYRGESAVLAMFALGVVATILWFMAVPAAHRRDTVVNIGLSIMNLAWIPLLASYLLVMLKQPDGVSLVVTVIGLTFVFDTAAFLGGSVMGGQFFERPLAPTVSPKKSIEGVIIATLVTAVVSVALVTNFVDPFQDMRIETLVLGLVVAVAATFGDLAESLIKRDLGIKDMGSILPGHGGLLDRIDSLLFVAPAAFLFYRIVFA
jgi:phosphatidate cytidylyltransferase